MQDKLESGSLEHSDGMIRFESLMIDYPKELSANLEKYGIESSDIVDKLHRPHSGDSPYKLSSEREIPGINIQLQINWTEEESERTWLGYVAQQIKDGYRLCPFERNHFNALQLRYYRDKFPKNVLDEKLIVPETGLPRPEIAIDYYESKQSSGTLTEQEQRDYDLKSKELGAIHAEILKKHLKEFKGKLGTLISGNRDAFNMLMVLTATFRNERLTYGKFPVWWDYDRFIHIYVGHVKELQFGDRDRVNTFFQYQLSDVKKVVENVLKAITEDIDQHFEAYPDRDFKRNGKRSIYYNGDYYIINVHPSGRLMQFHKK